MSVLKGPDQAVSLADLRAHALFIDLFGEGSEEQLAELAGDVDRVHLGAGEVLFRQGEVSDALYLVTEGRLRVSVHQADGPATTVARAGVGDSAGAQGLLSAGRRSSTADAVDPSIVLRIPKPAIDRLAVSTPIVSKRFADFVNARFHREQIRRALTRIFGDQDDDVFEQLARDSESISVSRGEVLFRQGDAGDSMYIVLSGRLAVVHVDAQGTTAILNEMNPGESLGEVALLTGRPRAASVQALRDSDLVRISQERLEALLVEHPIAFHRFTRQVVLQLVGVTRDAARTEPAKGIALVALHGSVKIQDLARQLAQAMEEHGSTLRLDSLEVDRLLGAEGIANVGEADVSAPRIRTWLQENESQYRFIIYEADAHPTAWTERCLRQADHVMLVADAKEDPSPSSIEGLVRPARGTVSGQRVSLLLVHGESVSRPSNTGAWLSRRHVDGHQHLRWNDAAHVGRVARFLAGRSIGVVLSGGGARGFAHVGALQAMEEAGIPVDVVGGTSAGAFVSAQYALGFPTDRMLAEIGRVYRNSVKLTLPLVSMSSGRRYINKLKTCLGPVRVEDLWIPYFCVSSDMSRCAMEVHREGELWKCALASGNLPGLLPPVVHEGRLLFDGMFFNDLPVDVMRGICGRKGEVIAVDVSAPNDLAHSEPFGDGLSGWRVLWSRLNPFVPTIKLPGIVSILQRSAEMSSISRRKSQLDGYADLYLRMPVEGFDLLDFGAGEDIFRVGYQYARERLQERSADRA